VPRRHDAAARLSRQMMMLDGIVEVMKVAIG
jgi:hypothetical protein